MVKGIAWLGSVFQLAGFEINPRTLYILGLCWGTNSRCVVSHFIIFHTNPPIFPSHKVRKSKTNHDSSIKFNPKLFTTDSSNQFFIVPIFFKICQPLAVEFLEKCTSVAVSGTYGGRIGAVSGPYRGRIGAISGPYRGRIGTVSGPYRGRIGSKNFRNMCCRKKHVSQEKKMHWILTSFS